MTGPYSIDEIENEIHRLVVESKARDGELFPSKFILINMEKGGYTRDDFLKGAESLQGRGLITDDEKIADGFFDAFR